MEVHGNLNMMGNYLQQVAIAENDFPTSPKVGSLVFKNKILYICSELEGGIPFWVPLTKSLNMKRFVIASSLIEWVLVHNLNTSNVFVQVFDTDGKWIIPDSINTNVYNQVTITFNTPTAGSVILMRGELEGNEFPIIAYEESFTNLSTWTINHNLGYNPVVQCYIDDQLVQPQSIVHNSINQTTVQFSSSQSGTVRCI